MTDEGVRKGCMMLMTRMGWFNFRWSGTNIFNGLHILMGLWL